MDPDFDNDDELPPPTRRPRAHLPARPENTKIYQDPETGKFDENGRPLSSGLFTRNGLSKSTQDAKNFLPEARFTDEPGADLMATVCGLVKPSMYRTTPALCIRCRQPTLRQSEMISHLALMRVHTLCTSCGTNWWAEYVLSGYLNVETPTHD